VAATPAARITSDAVNPVLAAVAAGVAVTGGSITPVVAPLGFIPVSTAPEPRPVKPVDTPVFSGSMPSCLSTGLISVAESVAVVILNAILSGAKVVNLGA
jgi:hypothetical protein